MVGDELEMRETSMHLSQRTHSKISPSRLKTVTLSFLMFITYIVRTVDRFLTTIFFLCSGC